MAREVTPPNGVAPSAFDVLLRQIESFNKRLVRIETRLCQLMEHLELDPVNKETDHAH